MNWQNIFSSIQLNTDILLSVNSGFQLRWILQNRGLLVSSRWFFYIYLYQSRLSVDREAYHPLVTALHYSQVWIPENCSYHRFSNASLYRSVHVLQELMRSAGKVQVEDSCNRFSVCHNLYTCISMYPSRVLQNPFKSCSWATVPCVAYSVESPDYYLARKYTDLASTQFAEDCGTPPEEHWFNDWRMPFHTFIYFTQLARPHYIIYL